MQSVEGKISQAKAKLQLEQPYFGMLASRLELRQNDTIEAALSDGVVLDYNDEYMRALTLDEVTFILANGAMHAALAHENRKKNRMSWLWQSATDYAINDMLVQNGLHRAPKSLYDERFSGMYAEEIYAELKHEIQNEEFNDDEENEDGYNEQNRKSQEEITSPSNEQAQSKNRPVIEVENVERAVDEEFFEQLEKQVQQKASAMEELPDGIERFVEIIQSSKVDWQVVLRDAFEPFFKNDYAIMPPSKKLLYQNIYLPSIQSNHYTLTIAIDTSGSVDEALLAIFMAEVESIMMSINDYTIELLTCDEKIRSHETFYAGEMLHYRVEGGMGTSFDPVFEYIERELYTTQLLLYFSDLDGKLRVSEPNYSVVWVAPKAEVMPFGEVIVLE